MNFVHKTILTVSGGKKGWSAGNMPVLKLTTTGRTSGQPRECMLTSPIQQGDTFVVVASRGGDDHNPAWFVNLRANSTVWIETQTQAKHERRARIATSDERDEKEIQKSALNRITPRCIHKVAAPPGVGRHALGGGALRVQRQDDPCLLP